MKKIILSVVLLTAFISVMAQEVTVYKGTSPYGTVTTTATVPANIKAQFDKSYPGEVVVAWVPYNNWWRASYMEDNHLTYVFYNEAAINYRVSLPVTQNNVPEEVINTALKVYGPVVYSIARMKSADDADIYQVRINEMGSSRLTWMDASGVTVLNPFKPKTEVVVTTDQ